LVKSEADALAIAKQTLGLNGTQLDKYIFLQALSTQDSSELFVDLDPTLQYGVGH
jgi:hypothetical protein